MATESDQDPLRLCRESVSLFLEAELQKVLYSHLKIVLDETCWRIRGAIQHRLQQLKLGQGTLHSTYFTTALADIFGENGENVHVRLMKRNGFWGSALFFFKSFFSNKPPTSSAGGPGGAGVSPGQTTSFAGGEGYPTRMVQTTECVSSPIHPSIPVPSVVAACSSIGPSASLLVTLAEQCLSSIDFNLIAEGLLTGPRLGLVQMEKILSDKIAVCRNLHLQVLANITLLLLFFCLSFCVMIRREIFGHVCACLFCSSVLFCYSMLSPDFFFDNNGESLREESTLHERNIVNAGKGSLECCDRTGGICATG